MIIGNKPPIHLTYCLNIHPGETWDEHLDAIKRHATAVRERVAPGKRFGLGLRLGRRAADTLSAPAKLADFRALLDRENLYVFTINGFPYGRFHGTPVKADVYRPDWQTTERRDYTNRLADLLAAILPDGIRGSISTVPGSYKSWVHEKEQLRVIVSRLAQCAAHMHVLRKKTGKDICLALEPEPDCLIETTEELIAFLTGPLLRHGQAELTSLGYTREQAASMLRRHIGVCFDTAHAAVGFECIPSSLRALSRAGIRIGKVQLSAAMHLEADNASRKRLLDFSDPIYLHQVKVRTASGIIKSYDDLPDALAHAPEGSDAWRVHYHIPLFADLPGELRSTAELLEGETFALLSNGLSENLEIETYTFDVLPSSMRPMSVDDSIAKEYAWVLGRLAART